MAAHGGRCPHVAPGTAARPWRVATNLPKASLEMAYRNKGKQRRTLSDTYVRAAERIAEARRKGKNGRSETPDLVCPRMWLRVTDKGHRSFVYLARFPGSRNPTRRWLGDYPTTTLEKAREKAKKWDDLI